MKTGKNVVLCSFGMSILAIYLQKQLFPPPKESFQGFVLKFYAGVTCFNCRSVFSDNFGKVLLMTSIFFINCTKSIYRLDMLVAIFKERLLFAFHMKL